MLQFIAMNIMTQVLNLARRAGAGGDVPIGAVIVRDGKIIARGENLVQRKMNPTLHAEIVAINRACKKLGQKFLSDCDIYVSLEPCAMCATAISFSQRPMTRVAESPQTHACSIMTDTFGTQT